jgi:sugar phosphate isomerase/epimerase
VASFKEILKYAENSGVDVMIENTPGSNEISTLADYSYVMSKLSQAKVHLDVGHAFVQGG